MQYCIHLCIRRLFFCAFSQKLKAKKTQALKKTQGFLGQKLNVPVVSPHFCLKNSSFDIINSRILLKVAIILQSKPQKLQIWPKSHCYWSILSAFLKIKVKVFKKSMIYLKKLNDFVKKTQGFSQKTQGNCLKTQ